MEGRGAPMSPCVASRPRWTGWALLLALLLPACSADDNVDVTDGSAVMNEGGDAAGEDASSADGAAPVDVAAPGDGAAPPIEGGDALAADDAAEGGSLLTEGGTEDAGEGGAPGGVRAVKVMIISMFGPEGQV